jgi:hypothetical protein
MKLNFHLNIKVMATKDVPNLVFLNYINYFYLPK